MPRRAHHPRLAAFAFALLAAAFAASPASAEVQRIETPIVSASPQTDVAASVVSLHVPMLPGAAPHPEACDWISYERFRDVNGPASPMNASAVVILQPGILEGATAFDQVARNAIEDAAAQGRYIEVWAIDRRANCLEDHTGLDAAERSGDPTQALNYYFHGAVVDGKTFAGWNANNRVLADIGMQQTMVDEDAILTNELPSQPWREKHVICGGHSLGGPLTEIFASWDFDGNPKTTDDAGWRQCAGFFGFDTTLNAGIADRSALPQTGLLKTLTDNTLRFATSTAVRALKAGTVERDVDLLGINPETMTLLELVAIRASQAPDADATDLVKLVPHDKSIDAFFHIAGSPTLQDYLTKNTSIRDYRYTSMALLGQIMDDNGGVYGLVRSSFGYFSGAPLRINRLAAQGSIIPGFSALVSPDRLMLPQKLKIQPLMHWTNYNQLGSGPTQIGAGITSPDNEDADATQFARLVHEGPLNLTENDFPMRINVDLGLLAAGDRSGALADSIWGRATTRKPRMAVIAGDGVIKKGPFYDPHVIAPGYNHLDVLTAAKVQNNGLPEISSTTLANFVDSTVPAG